MYLHSASVLGKGWERGERKYLSLPTLLTMSKYVKVDGWGFDDGM